MGPRLSRISRYFVIEMAQVRRTEIEDDAKSTCRRPFSYTETFTAALWAGGTPLAEVAERQTR